MALDPPTPFDAYVIYDWSLKPQTQRVTATIDAVHVAPPTVSTSQPQKSQRSRSKCVTLKDTR